jgi:hypothetical protein
MNAVEQGKQERAAASCTDLANHLHLRMQQMQMK